MALSSYLTRRVTSMLVPKLPTTYGAFSRNASGREDCSTEILPKCSPEALALSECMKKKALKKRTMVKKVKSVFWHLIVDEKCCPKPCPDFPRFDDLYYKESDKLKRKYMRTWVECPECLYRPKKMCCRPTELLPPIDRRPRARPKTACEMGPKKSRGRPRSCPPFKLKGCKDGRKPPKCQQFRKKVICKKRCTLYPSFSECKKDKLRIPRGSECYCLRLPSTCEIYMEIDKEKTRGKN